MVSSIARFGSIVALVALLGCGGGGGGSTPAPQQATPTISAVNPAHGSPGEAITLTGTNFTSVSAVAFNGHAAFSYNVASATQINAVVPGDATTGAIQVTTASGQATSPAFTVDAAQAPAITSYSPSTLASGTVVTLVGTHFVGTTAVKFNGVDATTFTVDNDTQVRATAPSGLTTGTITVTTGGGIATSTAYTVNSSVQVQVLMNTGFEATSPIIWGGIPGSSTPTWTPITSPAGEPALPTWAGMGRWRLTRFTRTSGYPPRPPPRMSPSM